MNIAAIVVTHNRRALLAECLEALLAQTETCFDIWVVDNASHDDTEAYVTDMAGRCNRIRYENTGANLGGAGGFHFGIQKAVAAGYAYVWLMDDDAAPEPQALAALLAAADMLGERWAFLYSTVLWTDGTENRMNRPRISPACFETIALLQYGILRVQQATFVSLLLPARTVYQVGLPIAAFFIWGDDIEYTRRICLRHRLPGYLVGRSIVIHQTRSNVGSNCALDAPERIPLYRYAFRNEQYMYRKEGPRGWCHYTAKCIVSMAWILVKAPNHKGRRILAVCRGIWQGLFFFPKVEYIPSPEPAAPATALAAQKER